MTTATRTPPQHGERARYLRGCRCNACSDANSRWCKQYRVDRYRTGPRRVDASNARTTVERYLAGGWSYAAIATLIGCSDTVIVDLIAGKERISPTIDRRISRIPQQPAPLRGRAYANSVGTIRRGQALVAIGYPVHLIAAAVGVTPDSLGKTINHNKDQVLASTAQAMTAIYRQWARKPGPDERSRRRAQRLGWHGPMAWDDNIDDPTAIPDTDTGPSRSPIDLKPCGTPAAYRRHLRNKEPIDEACRVANTLDAADRKRARAAA